VGGPGGCIYARPSKSLNFRTFMQNHERSKDLKAEHGEFSKQIKLSGRNGTDLVILS
jgi:GTPase involved in cell partitioning and DNA repair